MKKFLLLLCICLSGYSQAQQAVGNDTWKKMYRAVPQKINNLVHTKLNAKFDYSKSYLNGDVWITLKPHFYATDSLLLDAKGMDIHKVEMVKNGKISPLTYTYDNLFLNIKLDKTYKNNETYTVFIRYTAKPDEFSVKGSAAIADAKGLYFINPKAEEKGKPVQIWTQGETEATSVWVPTIDRPNQKTTQEFNLTVPSKYVTLSNGKLTAQKKMADGTRTDTWVMSLPHAPYLFFIGVGDFAVVKDSYKGKEVNYYVDKEYEKTARKIFGNTPEMMQFFEKITGVEYPWVKYSQMVGRDFVSGAMENTTATLHQESAQQNARELIDQNAWESTIAHELFHQWFGDYVTAESWSNLTVNESFANYSQYLWSEYKYGADEAAFENFHEMQSYLLSPPSRSKDLVRFYYSDKEDMFDLVSYQKGGRILHMLRNFVGDSAFFKSLHEYLSTNKFGTGTAIKLKLAFEKITGQDLNWFFNQWYFGSGHPILEISHSYDIAEKMVRVYIKQTQAVDKVFKLQLPIDIYHGATHKRHMVWTDKKADTLSFPAATQPDLVNVDADKYTLALKKEKKSMAEYIHQFAYAKHFVDRADALDFAAQNVSTREGYDLLVKGIHDPSYRLRIKAITGLSDTIPDAATISTIESVAKTDIHTLVRAAAIDILGRLKNNHYKAFFLKGTNDSSYSVAGASLEALAALDSSEALRIANNLQKEPGKGRLSTAIANTIIQFGDESAYDFITDNFAKMPVTYSKIEATASYAGFLAKVSDLQKFKKGVDLIVQFRDAIPQSARSQTDPIFSDVLGELAAQKKGIGENEMVAYIKTKLLK